MAALDRETLIATLETSENLKDAARRLNMSRQGLYQALQRHKIKAKRQTVYQTIKRIEITELN